MKYAKIKIFMDNSFPFIFCGMFLLMGCVSIPTRPNPPANVVETGLIPSPSSEYKTEMTTDEEGIYLRDDFFQVATTADLEDNHVVFVLEFTNRSDETVKFSPENISLVGLDDTMVPQMTVDEVTEPFKQAIERVEKKLERKAQESERLSESEKRERESREARSKSTKRSSDLQKGLVLGAGFLSLLGDIMEIQDDSKKREKLKKARDTYEAMYKRFKSFSLRATNVLPGKKAVGIVFFAKPSFWPATFVVHANKRPLGVVFHPPASRKNKGMH